jgi:hypothetical protein
MEHQKINRKRARALVAEPFGEILAILDRASRNGTRAHLEQHHVRALIQSAVFILLSELRQEEMSIRWEREDQTLGEHSSASIGSGIARIATTGASAGLTDGPLAAAVSASAVAARMIRQKERSKR